MGLFSNTVMLRAGMSYDDLTNAIATVVGRPELNEKNVNILTETHEPYIYTLLVNRPSPYDFNSQKEEDNSWGKYVFKNISRSKKIYGKERLLNRVREDMVKKGDMMSTDDVLEILAISALLLCSFNVRYISPIKPKNGF